MAVIGRFLASALGRLWGLIGPTLLSVIIEKISGWLRSWKARAEIRAAAKAEREATEAAKTAKEREDAADQNRRL